MDPYIEACGLWEDFHGNLIHQIGLKLADAVPEHYLVRTGERAYVVLVGSEGRKRYPFVPDVSITAARGRRKPTKKGSTALAEPADGAETVTMRAFIQEEHREAFVEIYEASPDQRLVTCLEVLSPSNKHPGTEGWELYQRKRQSLLLGNVNLVEVDLLRGGHRMPMMDPWPDSPYTIMVSRAKQQLCRVWRAHFRAPLPTIAVPLAKADPDIQLDIQPMIAEIYQRFRYERSIDYDKSLNPPLGPEDAAWLKKRLQGRRVEPLGAARK
jgi:hypothetical protein